MERREFLRQMSLTLAATWTAGRLLRPWPARAAAADLRLALVADAHLKSGDDRRAEALALARAVAEIRVLSPPPDLAIFAGDLAHQGRADALDLGREILADLPAPLLAVRGEGDHGPRDYAWGRRFGEPRFSVPYRGAHLIGLDPVLTPTPRGPVFELGPAQRRWLAAALAALDPAAPLIVVSHAPLARLFHPWQQWTEDAPEILPLFSRFRQVICLHGHVHNAGVRGQGPEVRNDNLGTTFCSWSFTENRKPKTENHLSLPATAWPRPQAVQGTPAVPRPGLRPHGCGWALLTLRAPQADFQPHLWRA
jgi:Icc protein